MTPRIFIPCVAWLVVACSGGASEPPSGTNATPDDSNVTPDGGASDGGATDAHNAHTSTGSSANGQLTIVSVTPTSTIMTGGAPLATESSAVTFIAIVTDTAGLDAIAGGQLMDDTGATYAAFGAGANKGTFSATLDWVTMNQIRVAEFTAPGGKRTFIAKFFDNLKNEATASVELNLACRRASGESVGACGGACSAVARERKNCGSCGNVCATSVCFNGTCAPPPFAPVPTDPKFVQTDCLPRSAFESGMNCGTLCDEYQRVTGQDVDCGQLFYFAPTDTTCSGGATGGDCLNNMSSVIGGSNGPVRCRCKIK